MADLKTIASGVAGGVATTIVLAVLGYLFGWIVQVPVPHGAVVAFERVECPASWEAMTAARGRYIVGLNDNGHLGAVQGTPLTDLENRAAGLHTHTYDTPYVGGSGGEIAWGKDADRNLLKSRETKPNENGVPGTNAPYVQLLWCRKI